MIMGLKNQKKHYHDMYCALRRIDEDNDSVVLAAWGIDIISEFSEYEIQDMIYDLELIEFFESYEDWCENSVDPTQLDLRFVLSGVGIDYHNSDEELIDLVVKNNVSLEDWLSEYSRLSDDGKQLLNDLRWVEIYFKYLEDFDFDDFYNFISDKSGTIKDIVLEYLNEHLKIAKISENSQYVADCESAKRLIELSWKKELEFKESSSEIMQKFEMYVQKKYEVKEEQDSQKTGGIDSDAITEIDFCKMADNRYRLVPRDNDSYVMPVKLKQFEYYKSVEEFNDADLALYDLAFVPWCLRERLRDLSFEEGFLTHHACKSNWKDFSKDLKVKQLKKFLKKHEMNISGDKKELVSRIAKSNLPLDELTSEKTFLSDKAYDFLREYGWIQFYLDNLSFFDFLDYEDYLMGHGGSGVECSSDYLDEHIKLAEKSLDFDYLTRCYDAKSRLCHLTGDLDGALTCDMKILHLNMNPLCLDHYRFSSHIPLTPENIFNLKELKSEFGEERIEESFNEYWNFLGFKSIIIPKDEVWNYLIRALNSQDQNYGNRKVREKYFMNFE